MGGGTHAEWLTFPCHMGQFEHFLLYILPDQTKLQLVAVIAWHEAKKRGGEQSNALLRPGGIQIR